MIQSWSPSSHQFYLFKWLEPDKEKLPIPGSLILICLDNAITYCRVHGNRQQTRESFFLSKTLPCAPWLLLVNWYNWGSCLKTKTSTTVAEGRATPIAGMIHPHPGWMFCTSACNGAHQGHTCQNPPLNQVLQGFNIPELRNCLCQKNTAIWKQQQHVIEIIYLPLEHHKNRHTMC